MVSPAGVLLLGECRGAGRFRGTWAGALQESDGRGYLGVGGRAWIHGGVLSSYGHWWGAAPHCAHLALGWDWSTGPLHWAGPSPQTRKEGLT